MKAIELIADVDAQHRLSARVPEDVPTGPVRVLLLVPEEEQADNVWMRAIAAEWSEDLSDTRQDLYSLDDGLPREGAG